MVAGQQFDEIIRINDYILKNLIYPLDPILLKQESNQEHNCHFL